MFPKMPSNMSCISNGMSFGSNPGPPPVPSNAAEPNWSYCFLFSSSFRTWFVAKQSQICYNTDSKHNVQNKQHWFFAASPQQLYLLCLCLGDISLPAVVDKLGIQNKKRNRQITIEMANKLWMRCHGYLVIRFLQFFLRSSAWHAQQFIIIFFLLGGCYRTEGKGPQKDLGKRQ